MTQLKTIRVVVADDHDLLRSGLAVFIDSCPDIELVGEAATGGEAVALCTRLKPDVVLMDLKMPQMDGMTATRLIRQQSPETQVIALTSFVDDQLVQSALSAGAMSYLLKNVSIDGLLSAIRSAAAGHPTLSQEATQALISAAQRPSSPDVHLTRREREVLTLLVRGMSNSEIARDLGVGISTVKKHVSNILVKLETNSRTEAVALSIKRKLVDF
jgi:two-component system, NarL family, response regulator LiaR